MPVIKNETYKRFQEGKIIFDSVTEVQFKEWLDGIAQKKRPRDCSVAQARAIFILLFFTGRRAAELVDLYPENILKQVDEKDNVWCYKLDIKTLKKGKQEVITLPTNHYIREVYDFMKRYPPGMACFHAFRKPNKNKYILKPKSPNPEIKTYDRRGKLLWNYCIEWTGRPPYWFRHYRFSSMASHGASSEIIQKFKGAKDIRSVEPYLHLSKKLAKETMKSLKF
jgi:site-specific recombinase XerD